MKVTAKDSELLHKLTFSLQLYANDKLKLLEGVSTLEDINYLPNEDSFRLRDALYKNSSLIDDYVADNPDRLNAEDLDIVKGWKYFVKGEFYIERHLKDYSVFLRNEHAYGVIAIKEDFEYFYPKSRLPVMVNTVLLPFKGGIIFDGLIQGYDIRFGGGIKKRLKETYMRAKQNDRILLSLNPSAAVLRARAKKNVAPQKDWSKEIGQLVSAAKKLKGGAGQPILNGQIFSLVKASVELANIGVLGSADTDTLLKETQKVARAINKLNNTLHRLD